MSNDSQLPPVVSYKPSAFYFRKALDEAKTLEEAKAVGRSTILELEALKEWVRQQGMIPPKTHVMRSEAVEKGWEALG